jgi:hypothetical protein
MDTEILSLILETLQAQEKTITTLQEELSELKNAQRVAENYSIRNIESHKDQLKKVRHSIQDIEDIDIEDELRNSCYFTELEEKVLGLEESGEENNELIQIIKDEDSVNGKDIIKKLCEVYHFLKS